MVIFLSIFSLDFFSIYLISFYDLDILHYHEDKFMICWSLVGSPLQ